MTSPDVLLSILSSLLIFGVIGVEVEEVGADCAVVVDLEGLPAALNALSKFGPVVVGGVNIVDVVLLAGVSIVVNV